MTSLVIVESPNKVRSIAGYLGDGFVVDSSVGHIRDLPDTKRNPVPAKYKGEPWVRLGVDIEDSFKPYYFVSTDKKQQMAKLKKLLAGADELILATDEDREGEAIAWHLFDELKPKVPVKRIVFNEITKGAILAAMENPRDIDMDLVDAQETRRILDRIYGFEVSPVLWRKIGQGTSAGRVQSVALRLVVERERARLAFRSASYWDLTATLSAPNGDAVQSFEAALVSVDSQKLATGKSFDDTGAMTAKNVVALDQTRAEELAAAATGQPAKVSSVEAKPYTRNPVPPFRTTTMQQDASRKWGWSAARTMQVAQRLYEGGFITYMRTDSITLSQTALKAAGVAVRELYGPEYHREQQYASKVKNAQEAHEAIRPAGESFQTPDQTRLSGDEAKLYKRIWKRTVASQMMPAKGETVSARFAINASNGEQLEFAASGTTITFKGWLKAYSEATEVVEDAEVVDDDATLPVLTEGQSLDVAGIAAEGHDTKPPARYTEATLIAELEKREIGRPSTYASIMSTLLNRGYVWKKGTALVPAWIGFNIVRLLEAHFSRLVDYSFTADLEQVLDDIANGRTDRVPVLESFWTGEGEGNTGLKRLLENLPDIDARAMATFPVGEDPDTGHTINVRVGRYGPYVEGPPLLPGDGGEVVPTRGNIPEDLPPDELTLAKAKELLANPAGQDKMLGTHPETGLDLVAKNGRFGPYVTELLPEDAPKTAKPRTASLFKDMTLDSLGIDDAVKLLTLPRVVGTDVDGVEITAQNGRYGPYLKKGTDSRSLEAEEQLLTLTEEQARAIYAQPKTCGRRGAAAAPLKELGEDPVSGKNIVVKDGRFGLYVTDGETNASLRKDDSLETLTAERAHELLAERRARGPVKRTTKRPAKKTAAKKTAAKKTAAKKTAAKKTAAKKTAAKKAT